MADHSFPPLTAQHQANMDQFHACCRELLDNYVTGFEMDMNRHAVKHGPMDQTRAHHDLTRILARDVPHNIIAGLIAEAILRGIARKAKGKG